MNDESVRFYPDAALEFSSGSRPGYWRWELVEASTDF